MWVLKYLKIGKNQISNINNLPKSLIRLEIFGNIKKIPEVLPPKIQFINLPDNKIKKIPDLSMYKNLEFLNLEKNPIKITGKERFPPNIKSLNIDGYNKENLLNIK